MGVKMLPTLAHGKAETEALTHCGVRVEGIQRGPSKLVGSGGPQSCLRVTPWNSYHSSPNQPGAGQPMELVRWSSIFDEHISSARTRLCRRQIKSVSRFSMQVPGYADPQRAWFRFFSTGSFLHLSTCSFWDGFCISWQSKAAVPVFIFQRGLVPSIKVVMPSRVPVVVAKLEAHRVGQECYRCRQKVVSTSGNIGESGNSWLACNTELSA